MRMEMGRENDLGRHHRDHNDAESKLKHRSSCRSSAGPVVRAVAPVAAARCTARHGALSGSAHQFVRAHATRATLYRGQNLLDRV